MRKLVYIFLPFLLLIFLLSGFFRKEIHPGQNNPVAVAENTVFELKEGDILIRPNWSWLPGSCPVADGRKYGHVALVTRGATGQSISEALENATVVEALFFDQATKEFQFKKENQIRQGKAIVSFGKKFTGIRYRLRIPLTETQAAVMRNFAETQLDGGYNILSVKQKNRKTDKMENLDWHCATLVWQAYFIATGLDIDANGGLFIYPSDIIACPIFERPDGIVRF